MTESRTETIVIVGQGYVGLPLAVSAAEAGFSVIGLDNSESLVKRLNSGYSHIEDVSDERLMGLIEAGRYQASNSFIDSRKAKICIICVPTPLSVSGLPDLTFLELAIKSVAPHIQDQTLLINESTSYPGTLRELIKRIVDENRKGGSASIMFASAPERIDPSNKQWNLKNTPRLISGLNRISTELAINFYSKICSNVVEVSSPEVAEMAKLLENTFRQVNIALVNQLVPFSRKIGVDIREVISAAGSKPYGFMEFYPGAGVGGHCIPIDPMYLLWKSRQLGIDLPFIEKADEVNGGMPRYVVSRLSELVSIKKGETALILGVAYKSGIADIRESPAGQVGKELSRKGIRVLWHDPLVEGFHDWEKWNLRESVKGAIIVTAQDGLPVNRLVEEGTLILDCTGKFSGLEGVTQL